VRWLAVGVLAASGSTAACRMIAEPAEGLVETELPPDVRADYEVFAQRCSKCHSLARPLLSRISDDNVWKEYVERMRRQASSGISPGDEPPILRFLHYYAVEKKRQHGGSE
jgi:hypothetical protein